MCDKCKNGIWCPTWAEWKCTVKAMRMTKPIMACDQFKRRPEDEDEPKCQCRECLERGEME